MMIPGWRRRSRGGTEPGFSRAWVLGGLAVVAALAAARADEKLAGIACRSVHLAYPAPRGTAFVNEVTVEQSAPGTYFCAAGFDRGYYGIQELGDGRKVVIFSVWDPGAQNDPKSVAAGQRVKLLDRDPAVRVGRFGGEGTGGQSFLDLDWKVGATYRFLVTSRPDGDDRTAYAAYLATPEAPAWRHLVTFSTTAPAGGRGAKPGSLGGYYGFIEDFRRNRVSATQPRAARFGPGWVRSLGPDGPGAWMPLAKARFTADANPSTAIDAEPLGRHFRLATGGPTRNSHARLNEVLTLSEPPKGDRPAGELPPEPGR